VNTTAWEPCRVLAGVIADRLASPAQVRDMGLPQGWWPQSLAHGAAGVALLHIERAHAGLGSWQRVRDWLACAADPVASGPGSHLFYGAPAVAFALRCAAVNSKGYAGALATLDREIAITTRHRLEAGHVRMDRGELPVLAEFDTIRGLTGIGAYLLRGDPGGELIRAVLAYLVRLTEPIAEDGEMLPGWWTSLSPAGTPSADFPGGHGNNGVAHGIGGPLCLLSIAVREGVAVDGQVSAIKRICGWLDQWRRGSGGASSWPYWVTRSHLSGRRPRAIRPLRPSWCYGTAGLARAQQLAAIATRDTTRQCMAEQALAGALTDPALRETTTDASLCHGYGGLIHITALAAADAVSPHLTCLPGLSARIMPPDASPAAVAACLVRQDIGLLEGAAGAALALHTVVTGRLPACGWDACLLIN
jgi:lantibiotic biosynthesis protein